MKVKIINKSGHELPEYKTTLSAGCDIRCVNFKDASIEAGTVKFQETEGGGVCAFMYPNSRVMFKTGLHIQLPEGYEAQIRGRSGMNKKTDIRIALGTIDADYTGEIGIIAENNSNRTCAISEGDRIAQMIIAPVVQAEWEDVKELNETKRGDGGFGSTGTK